MYILSILYLFFLSVNHFIYVQRRGFSAVYMSVFFFFLSLFLPLNGLVDLFHFFFFFRWFFSFRAFILSKSFSVIFLSFLFPPSRFFFFLCVQPSCFSNRFLFGFIPSSAFSISILLPDYSLLVSIFPLPLFGLSIILYPPLFAFYFSPSFFPFHFA